MPKKYVAFDKNIYIRVHHRTKEGQIRFNKADLEKFEKESGVSLENKDLLTVWIAKKE